MGDSQHRDMVQPYQGLVTCFNLYSFFVIYIYIFFLDESQATVKFVIAEVTHSS